MNITDNAKKYHDKMFPHYESKLAKTDPEFIERFDNFAFDEVVNEPGVELEPKTRMMCILAVLLGCQGLDEFKMMIKAALNFDVTPVEVKEIVYQAVDYLGIGRVYPYLNIVNEELISRGIALPLDGQATTTMENRLEKGIDKQVEIFGDSMKYFYKSGPEESRHINRWLASNCFKECTEKGIIIAGGVSEKGDIKNTNYVIDAYQLGINC